MNYICASNHGVDAVSNEMMKSEYKRREWTKKHNKHTNPVEKKFKLIYSDFV